MGITCHTHVFYLSSLVSLRGQSVSEQSELQASSHVHEKRGGKRRSSEFYSVRVRGTLTGPHGLTASKSYRYVKSRRGWGMHYVRVHTTTERERETSVLQQLNLQRREEGGRGRMWHFAADQLSAWTRSLVLSFSEAAHDDMIFG